MDESKELQSVYKVFRTVVYISLLLEFFEYAVNPSMFDNWSGILCDIHDRLKVWTIYRDGHLLHSKGFTFLLVCLTCVGTRAKKNFEFDARKMVLYPLVGGVLFVLVSVFFFNCTIAGLFYNLHTNIWLYMLCSVAGVVLTHVALDNISKFLKDGLLKDRFNFENESFEQCQQLIENKYSVNIPMRYYYKGKFRKGFVNIVNPFRGHKGSERPLKLRREYEYLLIYMTDNE